MYIKEEYNFTDLMDKCWCGAEDTLKVVQDNNKEEELFNLLYEEFNVYFGGIPTITEINDFLRFEWEYIFKRLEITEESKEECE